MPKWVKNHCTTHTLWDPLHNCPLLKMLSITFVQQLHVTTDCFGRVSINVSVCEPAHFHRWFIKREIKPTWNLRSATDLMNVGEGFSSLVLMKGIKNNPVSLFSSFPHSFQLLFQSLKSRYSASLPPILLSYMPRTARSSTPTEWAHCQRHKVSVSAQSR